MFGLKVRSFHVKKFNHDEWASEYDQDVLDENHPIRAGYSKLLTWIIQNAEINNRKEVLELGSGSGNLTGRIKECKRIVCVDISTEMEELAVPKTKHLKERVFFENDILAIFEQDIGVFDTVISTYTIHHLLDIEKKQLFAHIYRVLSDDGLVVFGDLMFENDKRKRAIIEAYENSGNEDIVKDIEEEYFWNIDKSIEELRTLGFITEVERFSDLSYGIKAMKQNRT